MNELLSPVKAADVLAARIQSLQKGRVLVAIDGMAASGKTTLAAALHAALPGSILIPMDDFFLPPEKRCGEYFKQHLANADIERFESEVLSPLLSGEAISYRPFVCHPEMKFLPAVNIPAGWRIALVEGAYCLHPALFDAYDLRILMTISPETQKARILKRNGEDMLLRFLRTWIPMENAHIAARQLLTRCDVHIHTP